MKNITRIIYKLLLLTVMTLVSPSIMGAGDFVIVIDAGHGGKDHGAMANGLSEKDINLGVAKKLASYLAKNVKEVTVIMTRNRDEFVSLQQRADIANKAHADLFISIHTNSVDESNPNREKVTGASTHVLGASKDEKNLEVARRENSVIKYEKNYKEKYENFDPDSDESYIIFEMVQKKNVQKSIDLAALIQTDLYKYAGRRNRGVQQNGFWVLWATSMPSVLVELDFICNPNSAKYLGSSKGQTELAKGIGEAVKTYIDRTKKTAQGEQEETAPAAAITGDYAVLATPVPADDRTAGTAPKPEKSATPAKRRRRSEASKERSQKRIVETDEIIVHSTDAHPVLTSQAPPQAAPEEKHVAKPASQQQPVATKADPNAKGKKPHNNRAKKVAQPARQTLPGKSPQGSATASKQNADNKQAPGNNGHKQTPPPAEHAKKSSKTSSAKPVAAPVGTGGASGAIVNVKKPRLNP